MNSKELAIEFIYDIDGTAHVHIKDDGKEYNPYELYMAYKCLQHVLNDINFDWSVEGTIETIVQKEEG